MAYDDSYDPPRCLANTQKLIVEDQVFALFCYVGTPTTVKILPLVEDARIPLLGMFTGANALREPFRPLPSSTSAPPTTRRPPPPSATWSMIWA